MDLGLVVLCVLVCVGFFLWGAAVASRQVADYAERATAEKRPAEEVIVMG